MHPSDSSSGSEHNYSLRNRGQHPSQDEETVTLVPVNQLSKNSQNSLLSSKAGDLVGELTNLRSNIDLMTDELQSLLATERAAVERAELLNTMTSHIRESLNFDYILNATVTDARNALEANRVIVLQFDPNWNGRIVAESVERHWVSLLNTEISDPDFSDRYLRFYERGKVQAIDDIEQSPISQGFYLNQLKTSETKASLTAPLLIDDQLYGLLITHQCSQTRHWTESEIEFFGQLAIQVGYALEQALLLDRQKDAAQQAQWLNQITLKIRESLVPNDIFKAAVAETKEALHADRVSVVTIGSDLAGHVASSVSSNQWPDAIGLNLMEPETIKGHYDSFLQGKSLVYDDITKVQFNEIELQKLQKLQVKSVLITPVIVGQNTLQALLVVHQCGKVHAWRETEVELVEKVALQMGYTLDQAYALEQQENAATQASIVNELTSRLTSSIELDDVLDVVVEDAQEIFKADRVLIYAIDDEEHTGQVVAEMVGNQWATMPGQTLAESGIDDRYLKLAKRGRLSFVQDIKELSNDQIIYRQLLDLSVQSFAVSPILIEKQLYGLLVIHYCQNKKTWSDAEINLLQQISNQLSFSWERINLIKQRQNTLDQAKRLNQISTRLQESPVAEDIFSVAVEETLEALQADRVVVYEFDKQWRGTIVAEALEPGWPASLGARIDDPCVTERYAKAYIKGRVSAYNDITKANLTECHVNQLKPFGVKANMVAGIVANQKLYGLLIAHQCKAPRKWNGGDMELIKQVSQQVGYALDQAFLLKEQEEAINRSRKVNEISFRIRESLDIDRIFRSGVEEALKLMQCDRVVVYRFDDNWDGRIIYEAVKTGWRKLSEDMMTSGDTPCFPEDYVEPYRQGRVQVTDDVSQAGLTACHEEQLGKWQVKANVVVPILVNQKLYGLLGAHQCSNTRQWQAPLVESFRQVAIQLGYALDQALLLQEVEQARQKAEKISEENFQQREVLQGQIETFLEQIENSFDGDLTVRAEVTEGEMGTVADFFNATLENLQVLVKQVKQSATVTAGTAQDNEKDVKNLAQEALRQAEVINDALQKIQNMTGSIQQVAGNAQDAQTKVSLTNQTLKAGDVAMNRTVQGILAIQQTVEATARKVKNLGEASQKISRVLSLIRELANQTNLLALNASVEATRTGEEDQGFAVANEVRTLAEQSANATKEIEEIIEEIQSETNEVVKAMDIGRKRVLIGTKLVKGARKTLTDLANVSSQLNQVVEEIARSATIQAQTSDELSHTMQEVVAIANQTSEQSVVVANSFGKLVEVAENLEQSVAQFKVD